jgi:hypothetical protein
MTIYSKYWRKSRSHHDATELALSLRALRKVAAHIGNNVKPIYWEGMVETDNRSIILDPEITNGLFPIRYNSFDILVGQVVLEGLSSIEWTEWVSDKVIKGFQELPETARPYLECIVNAAEDIYIQGLSKIPIWSLYLTSYWKSELKKEDRDPQLPPSPISLANTWEKKAILEEISPNLHFYYDDILEILTEYTEEIRKVSSLDSPAARRDKRIDMYTAMLSRVYLAISEWEEFEFGPQAINLLDEAGPQGDLPEDDFLKESDEEKEEEEEKEEKGLDPDLADEVSTLLEEEDANLTQSIAVAVRNPEAGFMETVVKRGVVKTSTHADELLLARLRNIFRKQESLIRQSRRKHVRRGLTEGKLDARRLYRVPLDGKVFKNREAPGHENYWQICVVADASASMAGKGEYQKPWLTAEKTFVALAEAAKAFRNLLDIYAYSAEKGVCVLTQLYHGSELFSVLPTGRTPSGQAIMGAAMRLSHKYKKKMIIHITDGAANCGLRLDEAIGYCEQNNVELFTIGCGCNKQTRDFLREYFTPETLFFMKNISYLPIGIERLFRKKVLLD